ncbi:carbohydrate-binding domain-containing protein [Tannockella kyphosi]|uniref:carbohydrate-binding domain-containing protein n=1 Tax=Tannockella kyphosi TaxID=2899121 RepID=UPI002012666B|nr:carbohydrate-binding domain-containing protein [Tannockella kyphosi]
MSKGKILIFISLALCLSGCSFVENVVDLVSETEIELYSGDTEGLFSDRDLEVGYDLTTCSNIVLVDGASSSDDASVSISDDIITISEEGTYFVSGSLSDGQIVVDASSDDKIQLVLGSICITNQSTAAISILQADKVFITMVSGSFNTLDVTIDESVSVYEDTIIDGAIFSQDDVTINGDGQLVITTVDGNGISSKDDLVITSGTYVIEASNNGLEANDNLLIASGDFTITTGGGWQEAPATTASSTSMMPGMNSSSSSSSSSSSESSGGKAIESETLIYIKGGDFYLDSYDDAIHSDYEVIIDDGVFEIMTADDAIHSELNTVINGGTIDITMCYEGVEGQNVFINGGDVCIYSTDDGINVSQSDVVDNDEGIAVTITGGTIYIDSNDEGDGIDSNGSIYITGGMVFIESTDVTTDTSLDYEEDAIITGGTFIGLGSSGLTVENFSETTQGSMLIELSSVTTGSVILEDSDGNVILSVEPTKTYEVLIISSPDVEEGETYYLTTGTSTQTIEMSDLIYGESSSSSQNIFGGFSGR